MNLNWIFVGLDAAMLSAIVVIAALVMGLRRDRRHWQAETEELRSALEALQSKVEKPKSAEPVAAVYRVVPEAPAFVPAAAMSTDKRAEALALLRGGVDSGTVSGKLQLSDAETLLLEKVQSLLGPFDDGGR